MKNKLVLREAPTIFVALLLSFILWIYIPTVSYLANSTFFAFNVSQLILGMLIPFVISAVLIFAILLITDMHLAKNESAYLLITEKSGMHISIAHIFMLLIAVCIWIEGSILNRGLPQLTGEMDIFNSTPRLLIDLGVWILIIAVGLIFWKRLSKHFVFVLVSIVLILSLGIADVAILSKGTNETASENPSSVTAREVLDTASFSKDNNVLILVVDAMSTALVKDYLKNEPSANEAFEGFTFYENSLQSAQSTLWSIPSILKGEVYKGGSVSDYQDNLFSSDKSMIQKFQSAGYNTYTSSIVSKFNNYSEKDKGASSGGKLTSIKPTPQLYGQLAIRFTPYAFKNAISNRVGFTSDVDTYQMSDDGNLVAIGGGYDDSYDKTAYASLKNAVKVQNSSAPTFHFHHVNGPHAPYTTDSTGGTLPASEAESWYGLKEQSKWSFDNVIEFINNMKASNIYDNTTIIILGDHGDRLDDKSRTNYDYYPYAGLLIKPVNSKGKLSTSTVPMSHEYLSNLISDLHIEDKTLADLTKNLPDTRSMMSEKSYYLYGGTDVRNLKILKEVPIDLEFSPSTISKGKKYSLAILSDESNAAYPYEVNNINSDNGWGLRVTDDNSGFSFLTSITKGQNINAEFTVSTASTKGGEADFTPYTLTIRDKTSGAKSTYTINKHITQIQLDNIKVSDQSTVDFEISTSQRPNPKKIQILFTGIELK